MIRFIDINEVIISENALKQLEKVPTYIKEKLYKWIEQVKLLGLIEVRKVRSYNDELLKGELFGQRSIRLNRAYRAIYVLQNNQDINFVEIREVSKHDY